MTKIPTAHFDKDHYMNPHNVPDNQPKPPDEVDAATFKIYPDAQGMTRYVVDATFARKLLWERDDAKDMLSFYKLEWEQAKEQRDQAIKERDEHKETLRITIKANLEIAKDRDQWRECAEELAKTQKEMLDHVKIMHDKGWHELGVEGVWEQALTHFNQLKGNQP